MLNDKGKPAEATPYFKRACGEKSVAGCVGLGLIARDGRGRAADKAEAKQLFEKACRGGVKVGCKLASTL